MKIYAVRHGFTQMNGAQIINGQIDDDMLVEKGIEQVKAARSSLPAGLVHMYVSPLKRTRQTAEILDDGRGTPMSFHDELMEIHFGEFQGGPYFTDEGLKKKHRDIEYDYGPVGERAAQVKDRIISFLKKIRNKHKDNEALIVTHGGIIRTLTALNDGAPPGDIGNASVHIFDVEEILRNNNA